MITSRHRVLARPSAVVVAAGVLLVALGVAPAAAADPTDLFISEYFEGALGAEATALELFNGTTASIDLAVGGYAIEIHHNGEPPLEAIALSGTIPSGAAFVIASPNSVEPVRLHANQFDERLDFSGNDLVVLKKGAAILDSIGRFGENPGSGGWGTQPTNTVDVDLRRLPTVTAGDTDPSDPYDPAGEWQAFETDAYDGLGSHTLGGGGGGGGGGGPVQSKSVAADVTIDAVTACIELSTTQITFGTLGFAALGQPATPKVTVTNCGEDPLDLLASGTQATASGVTWTLVDGTNTCTSNPPLGVDQYKLALDVPGRSLLRLALVNKDVETMAPGASSEHTAHIWTPCPGSTGDGQTVSFDINYTAVAGE